MECHQVGVSVRDRGNLVAKLFRSLPFIHSEAYKQQLLLDLPNYARARVPSTFFDARCWTTPLDDAMQSFTLMDGWWLTGSSQKQEVKGLESFSDARFWDNCLRLSLIHI